MYLCLAATYSGWSSSRRCLIQIDRTVAHLFLPYRERRAFHVCFWITRNFGSWHSFNLPRKPWYGRFGRSFRFADQRCVFPRSRFGLRVGQTVVYEPRVAGNVSDSTAHEPARSFGDGGRAEAASLSGNSVTAGGPETEFQEGLDADWLHVVVNRAEVEAIDVSRTAVVLSRVLVDRSAVQRYRGRVDLSFRGYSNDPRELYEIQEVRQFCKQIG